MLRSVAGMLSPDGRCKTFDATADGYIRGEGAGAILLKPADSAEEGRCLRIAEVRLKGEVLALNERIERKMGEWSGSIKSLFCQTGSGWMGHLCPKNGPQAEINFVSSGAGSGSLAAAST